MGRRLQIIAGDIEFQKTLTQAEKDYINKGCNWISKVGRETTLKGLHHIGYTLDQVMELPEAEQDEIYAKADEAWEKYVDEGNVEAPFKFI